MIIKRYERQKHEHTSNMSQHAHTHRQTAQTRERVEQKENNQTKVYFMCWIIENKSLSVLKHARTKHTHQM